MNKHGSGCSAGLDTQSRRDDLKVAQDVSPGLALEEKGSPGGTAESIPSSAVPTGLAELLGSVPRTDVLGYFQVVPSGLEPRSKGGASIWCDGNNDNLMDAVHFSLNLPQAS